MKSTILVGTRKGLITFKLKNNGTYEVENISFEGMPVSIAYADGISGTWWAALDHGHWGVKLHRSMDRGNQWEEVNAPAYPEGSEIKPGTKASLNYIWAISNGGKSFPSRLWVGTDPGGLFLSEDAGNTYNLVESLWNHPSRKDNWFGGGRDNPGIHSVVVDPRNENRVLIGVSCAGVFETTDAGKKWAVMNKGLRAEFLPNPDSEVGHDPHLLVASPSNPDILWQQNHCGIFRSVDGAKSWQEISEPEGPAKFGFTIAVAEDNSDQAWVCPANSDATRTAIKGQLLVCRTDDGGKSWKALSQGLPRKHCFDIVYRHSLACSGDSLAFGTTTGNFFLSRDRGEHWEVLSNYLPMVYSVQFAD